MPAGRAQLFLARTIFGLHPHKVWVMVNGLRGAAPRSLNPYSPFPTQDFRPNLLG